MGRKVWVWAPLYEGDSGTREIRRIRIGSVHEDPNEDDIRWVATAAFVAGEFRSRSTVTRVRVVEISPVDGNYVVLFDDTPDAARALYAERARPRIQEIIDSSNIAPCRSCGDCKAAGSCSALVNVDGALGQSGRGFKSRSVSPSQLEQYNRCPAQWFLDASTHLPRNRETGEAARRGIAVHRSLANAHKRGVACTLTDLPIPGNGDEYHGEFLTAEEYAAAYPYLVQHTSQCPLDDAAFELVCIETDIYGYDHESQVVLATRPDIVYRTGDVLRICETKTAGVARVLDRDEAYDKHFQIPFILTLLSKGLVEYLGAKSAILDLEILTPTEQKVWSWSLDEGNLPAIASGDVRRATDTWHLDESWIASPGPHCAWCPVREWCPDRGQVKKDLSDEADSGNLDVEEYGEAPF